MWQDLAHFKRLRTSHLVKPTLTHGIQLAVYRHSPHKHVQKFWSSTTDNKVFRPTQHSYRLVERALLHPTHSSPPNVEEAKAIAPFKLHSHPAWYGQKFSRLLTNRPVRPHQKGGSGTLRRLGVASGQHLRTKGFGKKCSLQDPQEQQICTSYVREVDISVVLLLEEAGFADPAHEQCWQNLAEGTDGMEVQLLQQNCSRQTWSNRIPLKFYSNTCICGLTSATDGTSTILVAFAALRMLFQCHQQQSAQSLAPSNMGMATHYQTHWKGRHS